MVEIPPYIRVVQGNSVRSSNKADSPGRPSGKTGGANSSVDTFAPDKIKDVVKLVSGENRRASASDIPTALEAEQSLRQLEKELPSLGQRVGDLHSGMDRRIILALLAPLVDA